jgi:hypothetical protein
VLLSLVKTSTDENGDRRLEREAQWLRELSGVESLEGQVPRLLEEGWRDGHRYLVLSLAQGAMQETRAFTPDHARFLASLGKARFRVSEFEGAGGCQWLQRAVRDFEKEKFYGELQAAYSDCEAALLYWTGPYVLSQGDFAPWNIRTFGSQLFVFDWGHARRGEPARRRAALPDGAARAAQPADRRALPALGDAARERLRAPGLPRMDLAPARHRRADAGLPSRRGDAPRARQWLLRGQPVLAPARATIRMDARLIFLKKEKT